MAASHSRGLGPHPSHSQRKPDEEPSRIFLTRRRSLSTICSPTQINKGETSCQNGLVYNYMRSGMGLYITICGQVEWFDPLTRQQFSIYFFVKATVY